MLQQNHLNASNRTLKKYRIVSEEVEYKSNMNNAIFNVGYHAVFFETIIIPVNINLEDITDLQIRYNNNIIWNIPFNIVTDYSVKIINKKYFITLSSNLFGQCHYTHIKIEDKFIIPIYALLNNLSFGIHSKHEFKYKLISKYIIYNSSIDLIDPISLTCDVFHYYKFPINKTISIKNLNMTSFGLIVKITKPIIDYDLSINNIMTSYTRDLIEYYRFLYCKRTIWTKKHSLMLRYSLNKILPYDIINIIESYFNDSYLYSYYFPFDMYNKNYINLLSTNVINLELETAENEYNGTIYCKILKKLTIKNNHMFISD